MYIGKQPIYFNFIGIDRETGEEREVHPRDVPNIDRTDRFAAAFGLRRVEPHEITEAI
jgi:hypothetical protein